MWNLTHLLSTLNGSYLFRKNKSSPALYLPILFLTCYRLFQVNKFKKIFSNKYSQTPLRFLKTELTHTFPTLHTPNYFPCSFCR